MQLYTKIVTKPVPILYKLTDLSLTHRGLETRTKEMIGRIRREGGAMRWVGRDSAQPDAGFARRRAAMNDIQRCSPFFWREPRKKRLGIALCLQRSAKVLVRGLVKFVPAS